MRTFLSVVLTLAMAGSLSIRSAEAVPSACLGSFQRMFIENTELHRHFKVEIAQVLDESVLAVIEKSTGEAKGPKPPGSEQAYLNLYLNAVRIIDRELLTSSCEVQFNDILFILSKRVSFSLKTADLKSIQPFRDKTELWRSRVIFGTHQAVLP